MRIYKARIHKRTIDIWGKKRKGKGNFVVGGWKAQSPFSSPVTREGNETVIHSPIRSPFQRTQESIESQRRENAERESKRLHNLRYQASVERQKTSIQEAKAKRRRIRRSRNAPYEGTIKRRKARRSSRAVYREERPERQGRVPSGFYYNVAAGEYQPKPRGHYNVASGEWE